MENTKAEEFYNLKLYASNPWDDTLNGKIKNIILSSGRCKGNIGHMNLTDKFLKMFDHFMILSHSIDG